MVRGGRGYGSRSSYRGSSNRGNSSWNGSARGNYSGYSDSRNKYDRFSNRDDYHKSYKSESSYLSRESRRSPDRKRLRAEAPSSRHDYYGSYGSSRHEPPSYSERRGYSGERHTSTPFSRREEYRRSSGPPSRGPYRGRISSRGSRGLKGRERAGRRRLIDSSYSIRRRTIPRSSAWKAKVSRMRSAIVRKYAAKRRAEERSESKEEKKVKKEEDQEEKDEKTEKTEKESKDESKDEKTETAEERAQQKKSFIKLQCPHCGVKSITFQGYEMHFRGRTHIIAMRKIASKQKSILAQMRQAQRNTQNELEKNSDELTDRTNYCPLCKLNYKQKRAVHQLSEAHQNMKKFLIPQCKICNIIFKSPMGYEIHCCSIKHIKRQQRVDNAGDGSGDDDLENFTTIDSVGEGDGSEDAEGKETVNVGIEQIRKIEAHYCDLCKMYLQRGEESEMSEILSRHCSQKVHRKRYLRLKDSETKKEEKEEIETKQETEEPASETDVKAEDNLDKDDKLWADVDKDLGDILAEAQSGNKSSDEDEEDSHVNGERYDRFKLSILNEGEGTSEKAEN